MKPVAIIQNWAAESAGNLSDYLDDNQIDYQVIKAFDGETLPKVNDLSAAIVLGTPISVRDYRSHDYLTGLFAFMSDAVLRDLPLLGICFGGQLLARVLGAEVTRNPVREIGLYQAELTSDGLNDKLFDGLRSPLEVFHWHADSFQIPSGATLLATGKTCTNQAFRKGNAVGVQFHIEPRADEIPLWCDAYAAELSEEGLAKDQLVAAYGDKADQMKTLSYRLMQNFLK